MSTYAEDFVTHIANLMTHCHEDAQQELSDIYARSDILTLKDGPIILNSMLELAVENKRPDLAEALVGQYCDCPKLKIQKYLLLAFKCKAVRCSDIIQKTLGAGSKSPQDCTKPKGIRR